MKVAYLAPELPALSATFVYNEILELEKLETNVIPFSVHYPTGSFENESLKSLKQKVKVLYDGNKMALFISHFRLLRKRPQGYFKSVSQLVSDMGRLGLCRNTVGLVYRFLHSAVLADELLKHGCEHLHVHFAHVPTDIAMYASSMSGVSFSVTSHANDLFERGWLLKEKISRSKFFGTISEFNKRFLSEHVSESRKVPVIRCGVDPSQFKTRRWQALSKPIKIGVVGRLVEKKGIDVLIRATGLLAREGYDISLSIAGSGPLDEELKSLARQLKIDDKVDFLGSLPHSEIAGYINALDVFVLPCKQDKQGDMDGIPVVLMEAMLSGVPVISTQVSGIPELVVDGESGACVISNDAQALTKAIVNVFNDRTHTKLMVKQAVEKVKVDFSLTKNVARLNELFGQKDKS
jgi:glycosyltransferase involved in cell wall biosynthesis